ncbi:MAG: PadR family transcriptional regulator [Acetobacteraceae bacterium]|nr:PadR family transcriptional regulator [Acetobacteraceae bacterium]
MALGDAILVCLTERPMTGYDLARAFDASIGFFWRADHQQIYRELGHLRDAAKVEVREVAQSGKPNKLVYSITANGRSALKAWSARPAAPPSIKDDLLVRLYALEHVDRDALCIQLALRLDHHRARLARYERILAERFTGRPLTPSETGKLLGLRAGLRYERGWVDWCEEASTLLADRAGGNVVPITAGQGAGP